MNRRTLAMPLAAALLAACAGTSTARAPDGVPIAYDVRGRGDPALVFIHGWCGDRAVWREQLDAFAGEHRVIGIDLAGHGASRGERAAWSVADLAGDVVAVADDLTLDSMILVGHSMGGPVALAAAARMPGRVRAVIGVDSLHNAEPDYAPDAFDPLVASFEADFPSALRRMVGSMVSPDADPALLPWLLARTATADRDAALALLRDYPTLDFAALLRNAGCPVRCLNAATPYTTVVDINRKHADFDAVLLEDVGHFPMLEQPAQFNAALRETLRDLAKRK